MTKEKMGAITLVLGVVLMLLAIVFVPFAVIWAINTLFPVLAIPYNFWTWLAMIVMNLTILYKPSIGAK